ncbi:MAG TPA: lyase family protein [Burkholderiales bacterium]|nr:lyase family protein [Burkholderiales bacterium]
MARFEGALARASARTKIIPAAEAQIIAQACECARFDSPALAAAARGAGTLAIPFVRQLTAEVAAISPQAARYVHFGATSQDVLDSALALCLQAACKRILSLTARVGDATAAIARRHAGTPTLARTLLQPAVPVPFGWKAAVWLSLLTRSYSRFRSTAADACVLQFGGPAGTLSAFGADGDAVSRALAEELGLGVPSISWHSARDAFARLGAEAAILSGAAAKIARDVSLLMQPEVGEAAEPAAPGRGGSSSLPHKRNPAASLLALEAAQRAPGLAATLLVQLTPEHERGLGQWQSQWLVLRQLLGAAGSALAAMAEALEGLQVDAGRMLENLERTRGLVFSEAVAVRLSQTLGKAAAHALTEKLCERAVHEGKTLLEVMRADPQIKLDDAELQRLFQPESCYGTAAAMIERSLAEWSALQSSGKPT